MSVRVSTSSTALAGVMRRRPFAAAGSIPVLRRVPLLQLVAWFGAHALLGAAWKLSPTLGLAHGLCTAGAAVLAGVRGNPTTVAGVALYVGASEIIWRMSKAPLPHLLGMYLVILLCSLAALRRRRLPPPTAWLYFLPLVPSAWFTFAGVADLDRARQLVAFNLAGPAALFAVLWFCHTVRGRIDLWRTAAMGGGPVAATSAAILLGILRAEEIRFTTESNFATSGGFGPNQVASVLSLGLLLLAGYAWLRGRGHAKPLAWVLIAALAVQTLLTFSRAGVAMVLGALVGMGVLLLKRRELRVAVVVSALGVWGFSHWLLVPVLDDVTQGAFVARYTSPDVSSRDVIAKTDLQLFRENPTLGVGPGMGSQFRAERMGQSIAAHTEFTRVLAEHGLLGAVSLLTLIALTLRSVLRADNTPRRAWVLGMFTWAWLYWAVNAFRTAMPATAIMLALLILAGQAARARGSPNQVGVVSIGQPLRQTRKEGLPPGTMMAKIR